MIIVSASQFHVYLPWVSGLSPLNVTALVSRHECGNCRWLDCSSNFDLLCVQTLLQRRGPLPAGRGRLWPRHAVRGQPRVRQQQLRRGGHHHGLLREAVAVSTVHVLLKMEMELKKNCLHFIEIQLNREKCLRATWHNLSHAFEYIQASVIWFNGGVFPNWSWLWSYFITLVSNIFTVYYTTIKTRPQMEWSYHECV